MFDKLSIEHEDTFIADFAVGDVFGALHGRFQCGGEYVYVRGKPRGSSPEEDRADAGPGRRRTVH